jgi:hypothetical protein
MKIATICQQDFSYEITFANRQKLVFTEILLGSAII